MSVSICARIAAAVAISFVVVACSDAPSFVLEAADGSVDAATVDASVDSAAPPDSSTPVDATLDAAPVDAAPVDAGPPRPTTTCIAQAPTVANIRCSAAAPGALGGGSIAAGDYVMNRSFGPTCKGYASGAATIYQDGPNLFMRWLRIEDRVNSGDAGVQRSGTVWLRPSAPNRIERVEVCDPGNVGKSEVGTFGVAGNGDLQVDFGTYSEGWQRMP
jgi:hypothetical protein